MLWAEFCGVPWRGTDCTQRQHLIGVDVVFEVVEDADEVISLSVGIGS